MKKLLKLTLTFSFLFVASQIKAQVRIGPEAGLNFAKMTLEQSGTKTNSSFLTEFHAGLDVEVGLTKALFLKSGVLYSVKGTKATSYGEEVQMDPNYIEVPVNLLYKFNIGGPKLFLLAGPYFAYGVAGKRKTGSSSIKLNFGKNFTSDMRPFDYGVNFGLGLEISGFQISGKYEMGIPNLAPILPSTFNIKNESFQVSLTYLIGKK